MSDVKFEGAADLSEFEGDDFRVKEFLSRCRGHRYSVTAYAGPYDRRNGDRVISLSFSVHDQLKFRGVVIDRSLYDLIEWVEVLVDGCMIRLRSTPSAEMVGAWVNAGSKFVMPLAVAPGSRHIDFRFRLNPVKQATELYLDALFAETDPEPVRPAAPAARFSWRNWIIAFCSGGLFTIGMVLILS